MVPDWGLIIVYMAAMPVHRRAYALNNSFLAKQSRVVVGEYT